MKVNEVQPEFVKEIPREPEPGKLYISMEYGTVLHLCCCGCGSEVVTPLHPTRWKLIYDGEAVSLHPSIGSWSLPCQSHYFISGNHVRWAPVWSRDDIEEVRARDRADVAHYFDPSSTESAMDELETLADSGNTRRSIVAQLWRRLTRR